MGELLDGLTIEMWRDRALIAERDRNGDGWRRRTKAMEFALGLADHGVPDWEKNARHIDRFLATGSFEEPTQIEYAQSVLGTRS